MRFHSLLPLGLLLSSFGSCRPGAGQPETTGIDSTNTDVVHSKYLESHGYSILKNRDGIYWIFSESYVGVGAAVKISIDTEHKSVTILENNLDQGIVDVEKLKLPQIFRGLCIAKNLPCNEMTSIAMDIDEWFTHGSVKKHRQDNSLADQDFDIAPNQLGWEIFSKTSFYNDATKMFPGFEAEMITIKQQKRASPTPSPRGFKLRKVAIA
ncbi:hypothetical protein CFIMG_007849RA00001 [Ceratocystis fimbriata CBS 114723]|uniref:Uncharacterized protein n=1 Tax=Ceratocystis fimbriata CBS 114723 TaxID=1035309 RepID=A0A2C5WU75_9PEZI|nr:hypothetical protein CFIMG_007849RA00001 [Ceratocystis fimbriata CBS 114723]